MTIFIKLLVGLVLFGTLVALYVFNVPNSDHLKWLCEVGLVGMGYMHMDGKNNSASPAPKDGGFFRLGFLPILGGLALCMTACVTPTTTAQAQMTYVQACAAYNAAFGTAVALKQADKLSPSQIQQISLIDATITPLCTGPLPANPQAATTQITAAVTSLAILEAINKE